MNHIFNEEEGMPTHSSMLAWGISMGRETWQTIVHGVEKSQDITGRLKYSKNRLTTLEHVRYVFFGEKTALVISP